MKRTPRPRFKNVHHGGNFCQTFYVDKMSVANATTVQVTSVDLYFKAKPAETTNVSNIRKPGVTVHICETDPNNNNSPIIKRIHRHGYARVEYDSINVSNTAATSTKFTFQKPVSIDVDTVYGILISIDGGDKGYQIYKLTTGETSSNGTLGVVSKGKLDGKLYKITNGTTLKPNSDTDLKLKVNIAKYSSLSKTVKLKPKDYEFFKVHGTTWSSSTFRGGEYVYQNTGYPSGQTINISTTSYAVVGTGTAFSSQFHAGDSIVLTDNTASNVDVRIVNSVSNNTYLTLKRPPSFSNATAKFLISPVAKVRYIDRLSDRVTLIKSTATSATMLWANGYSGPLYFLANNTVGNTKITIHGADSGASVKVADYLMLYPHKFHHQTDMELFACTDVNTSIYLANTTFYKEDVKHRLPKQKKHFFKYKAAIPSKSVVVRNPSNYYSGTGPNSEHPLEVQANITSNNSYSGPIIDTQEHSLIVYENVINNDETGETNPRDGSAYSAYVSKKITLADGQDAEDLKVYLTAWQPQGTLVSAYAKLLNKNDPEAFDDKYWTKLTLVSNTQYSNPDNFKDTVELEFRVPSTLTGNLISNTVLTVTNNSAVVASSNTTTNTYISVNDIVKVYSPLFPNNYVVDVVTAANTSTFTVSTPITNNNVVGSGLIVDVIPASSKHLAFNNVLNSNIVKYYNDSLSAFNTYKTFAIKLVFLSGSEQIAPRVYNLRAIAVSA